jgi:hypothetical protein
MTLCSMKFLEVRELNMGFRSSGRTSGKEHTGDEGTIEKRSKSLFDRALMIWPSPPKKDPARTAN